MLLCGCYSPPSDSRYFDMNIFASISSAIITSQDQFVIMGYMNGKIKDRGEMVRHDDNMSYVTCGGNSNSNGELLIAPCDKSPKSKSKLGRG